MQRLRIRLIDAIIRAQEANKEALALAIELAAQGDEVESTPTPSNVVREAKKTGPRLPFKTDTPPPQRRVSSTPTAYTHVAITDEKILAHLRKAYEEAATDEERDEVLRKMKQLVDQGVLKEQAVAEYFRS